MPSDLIISSAAWYNSSLSPELEASPLNSFSSANRVVRIHGPYVSEKEIEKITNILRAQGEPDYIEEITANEKNDNTDYATNDNTDELYNQALDIVKTEGKASTSFLQRKLQIGYNRAARIIDMMEEKGIVSKANHVGKREVL